MGNKSGERLRSSRPACATYQDPGHLSYRVTLWQNKYIKYCNFQLLLMYILFVLKKEFFIYYGFLLHLTSFSPTLSHDRSSWDIFSSSGDTHINYSTLGIWRINILLWSGYMCFLIYLWPFIALCIFGKNMSIVSIIKVKRQTGRTGFSSFWLEIHGVSSPDVSFRGLLPVSPSLEILIFTQG